MNVISAGMRFVGEEGCWPRTRHSILDWLINETRTERYIDIIFADLCERLRSADVPVSQASLQLTTCHPEWLGARISWSRAKGNAAIETLAYGIESTEEFLLSPANELRTGAKEVRQRLDSRPIARSWPTFSKLADEGVTEYVAWPIHHTLGQSHMISFATRAAGGFTSEHISFLKDLVPAIALISEIRLKNVLARTLLQTYVGSHASARILAGATTRGSGETISAAIMICDLRDFTHLSDIWPRDEVIDMLNGYFEAVSDPIERNGGEILKFLGDGLLAVFPLDEDDACCKLLASLKEARVNLVELNEENRKNNRPQLAHGVGVHVGDVMYGNIGTKKRLDFTVVGPAVNVTSRLEALTKKIGHPVLLSGAFADAARCRAGLQRVGLYPLKGLGEPVEVFALPAGY
ncbi:adenylate/guanylate cyclase domain-containing protein [Rhizobium leguminosarum bv. viciae]|nr:adenylate/guanylate cyclase domain-containing protein [Rhizobium leguminosarum bv. viciae]